MLITMVRKSRNIEGFKNVVTKIGATIDNPLAELI